MAAPSRGLLVALALASFATFATLATFARAPEARQRPPANPRTAAPAAQPAAPVKPWTPARTSWGDPDMDGVWNYATLTPLEYRFTVDDPTTWAKAWAAEVPMTRVPGPIYEYACHEGNERSVVGSLSGTLATDKARNPGRP